MIQFFRLSNDNYLVFSREIRIFSDEIGVFRPWKILFRFLEITKRHGLEIGGAFFPFQKGGLTHHLN
jgi:hypothetical protein